MAIAAEMLGEKGAHVGTVKGMQVNGLSKWEPVRKKQEMGANRA